MSEQKVAVEHREELLIQLCNVSEPCVCVCVFKNETRQCVRPHVLRDRLR